MWIWHCGSNSQVQKKRNSDLGDPFLWKGNHDNNTKCRSKMQTQYLILIVHGKKQQTSTGIPSLVTFHCLMSQHTELHLEVICIEEYFGRLWTQITMVLLCWSPQFIFLLHPGPKPCSLTASSPFLAAVCSCGYYLLSFDRNWNCTSENALPRVICSQQDLLATQ